MASLRRERLFEEYRKRKDTAELRFKNSFYALLIAYGGTLSGLGLYYYIKGLALLAGAGMFFGQLILNYATGSNERSALAYKTPYGLFRYLYLVLILLLITRFSKKRFFNYALTAVFIASFIYGVYCLLAGELEIWKSVLIMVQAFYGFWCCDITTRQLKELKFLSKQEGYPDFNIAIGEPVPIANTRGVYLRQYELLKEQSKKRAAELKADDVHGDSCVDIKDYLKESGTEGHTRKRHGRTLHRFRRFDRRTAEKSKIGKEHSL